MSHRRERVAQDLRNRMAQILAERVQDPRLRQVTITAVKPSPDLSFARVFYRTLGDQQQTAQALVRAKPFLRRCLAEGLRLKRVPELDFRLDDSLDTGARIDEILKEIRETQPRGDTGEPRGTGEEEPA